MKTKIITMVVIVAFLISDSCVATTPPSDTAIQVQTYGVLPTIFLNLTTLPAYVFVSPPPSSTPGLPLAAGLTGILTHGTQESYLTGVGSPGVIPANFSVPGNASLQPAVISTDGGKTFSYSPHPYSTNMTALFPSWNSTKPLLNNPNPIVTGSGYYEYPSDTSVVGGIIQYPPAPINGLASNAATTGMVNYSATSINVAIPYAESNEPDFHNYSVLITSLGLAESGSQLTPPNSTNAIADVFNGIDCVVTDVGAALTADPVAIAAAAIGTYNTIQQMSANVYNGQITNAYPAAYLGVTVAGFGNSASQAALWVLPSESTMYLIEGDNSSLLYQPQITPYTGWEDDNYLIIVNYRQKFANTGTATPTSSDTLIIALVNENVYQAAKAATLTKLTGKARAEESARLIGVFGQITKESIFDKAKIARIVGFGAPVSNARCSEQQKQNAATALKALLNKYRTRIPEIGKLALMQSR